MQKKLLIAGFTVLYLIAGCGAEAFGQRRTKSTRTKTTSVVQERKQGARDVGVQLTNLTKFLFVLGGVATGIEQIDKDVRAGRATPEIERSNREFKGNVIASVRALRGGLVKLTIDFRTKRGLKQYLPLIEGLVDESARAEDFATAGRFNQCGEQLLAIANRLTNVLVEMP
ncbi:MAG: hypothetical protein ACK5NT_00145 [Pyrinomonadaceae bacterium]